MTIGMGQTAPRAVPDGIDLILDADAMMCVFEAQRLARVDDYLRETVAEAGPSGVMAPTVLERSVRLELAAAMRVTEYAAGELMHRAAVLIHAHPGVFDALSHAQVTPRHTEVLVSLFDRAPADVVTELSDRALELAKTHPVGTFRRKLSELIEIARVVDATDRHEQALTQRRAFVEHAGDGMSWLHLYAPTVEVHAIYERATTIAKTVIDADRRAARCPGDDGRADADGDDDVPGTSRTRDQARADVLCDLLVDGAVPDHPESAHGIRATVVVTVPALSLLDDEAAKKAPATVERIGPIPIERARELCGGGKDWMRVLTHPETGVVLSVGREKYKPPARLRRLVTWRAERCMAPGCGVPASRCDVDHQFDFALGGETSVVNLCPLCRGHHVVKGHGRWRVVQLPGGVIEWTSPTGRVYLVEPERRTPAFVAASLEETPAPF